MILVPSKLQVNDNEDTKKHSIIAVAAAAANDCGATD